MCVARERHAVLAYAGTHVGRRAGRQAGRHISQDIKIPRERREPAENNFDDWRDEEQKSSKSERQIKI